MQLDIGWIYRDGKEREGGGGLEVWRERGLVESEKMVGDGW